MIDEISEEPSAPVEIVVAKICSCHGCKRQSKYDTETSFCFSILEKTVGYSRERIFFIPRPLQNGYYTFRQMEEIERALGGFDLDLLPLDWNLIH